MPYPYRFRLKVVKLVTERDFSLREAAERYGTSHSVVVTWLKDFRERGINRKNRRMPDR
ncbi:helix-turn-helix domain-containing protein [Exercitatus varius]|uniref:helix-turn-helix domain-containing protein n=1 Tax=Exercitatus varius TaxID=67857 RepID=UPI00374E8EC5